MKKIMIVCSTSFYDRIENISEMLMHYGYEIEYPNCYDEPVTADDNSHKTIEEYHNFYKEMYIESRNKISQIDEMLVLNFDKLKNGVTHKNYVGASTFLEIYEAYMQGKKIYLYTNLPDESNILYEDIKGMAPICLNGDIENIRK